MLNIIVLLILRRRCSIALSCAAALLLSALLSAAASAQDNRQEIKDIFAAVIGVTAQIPASARTAATLGTERSGSGVVIAEDGLIVTIGYLILGASSVEITLADGRAVPANILAYDHNTGFGLLRPLQPINVKPLPLGRSADLKEKDQVLIMTQGGENDIRPAFVVSRRPFAGYWEYLLEDAIFTSPPHPEFSGAALIGPAGDVLGIGSLVVSDAADAEEALPGNMFVPIDELKPILDDLQTSGRSPGPARPWLGIYTEEYRGHLFINRVAEDGPAARAGVAAGAILIGVNQSPVKSLIEFYRTLWAQGPAGADVTLTLLQDSEIVHVNVKTGDRYDWLQLQPSH